MTLYKKGFTLIELLVVIAIIGLLSSVVFASLNSARAKARDARRSADMSEIRKALELYFDKYNSYPVAQGATTWGMNCGGWTGDNAPANTFLQPLVTEGFFSASPDDPTLGTCQYQYRSEKSGQAFRLIFRYETKVNNDLNCYQPGGYSCIRENFDDVIE